MGWPSVIANWLSPEGKTEKLAFLWWGFFFFPTTWTQACAEGLPLPSHRKSRENTYIYKVSKVNYLTERVEREIFSLMSNRGSSASYSDSYLSLYLGRQWHWWLGGLPPNTDSGQGDIGALACKWSPDVESRGIRLRHRGDGGACPPHPHLSHTVQKRRVHFREPRAD